MASVVGGVESRGWRMRILARWAVVVAVGVLAGAVLPMPTWFGSGAVTVVAGVCVALSVCESVLAWRRRRARESS